MKPAIPFAPGLDLDIASQKGVGRRSGSIQVDARGRVVTGVSPRGEIPAGRDVAALSRDCALIQSALRGERAEGRMILDGANVAVEAHPLHGQTGGAFVLWREVWGETCQAALREASRLALEDAGIGFWEWRQDDDRYFWSVEIDALLGLPVGHGLRHGAGADQLFAFFHPEDHEALRRLRRQGFAADAVPVYLRIQSSAGAETTILVRGFEIVGGDGDGRLGAVGVVQDVTRSVRAGLALARQEEFFRTLALNFGDGFVALIDSGFRLLHVEGRGPFFACDDRSELLGRTVREAFSEAVAARLTLAVEETQEGRSAELEFPVGDEIYAVRVTSVGLAQEATRLSMLVATRIGERRRAEEALRRNEERHRTLLRHFPGGAVFFVDRSMRYIVAEGASLAQTGVDRSRLIGRSMSEILPPEAFETLAAQCRLSLKGRATETDIDLLGQAFFVQTVPLRGANGLIEGSMIVMRDVTRERALERRLQEAERVERLRITAALDGAPDAISIIEPSGRILYLNPAHRALFGYSETELNAEGGVRALFAQRHHAGSIFRRLRRGAPWTGEVDMQTRGGRIVPMVLRASPIRDPDGVIVGLAGIATDVSERRRAEEELRRREEMFRLLFEFAPIGMALLDAEGRFARVNAALCVLLGRSEGELSGRPMSAFSPLAESEEDPLESVRGGAVRHGSWERRFVGPDGRAISAVVSLASTKNSAGDDIFLAQIVDISQVKQAEAERQLLLEQIYQTQKLEALGRLAGGVAHDFNNVLAALMGFVWLADKQADRPDRVRGLLAKAQKAGERASGVIRQILTYGAKNVDTEIKPLDPTPIVEEAAGLLRASLGAAIDLKIQTPQSAPCVLADATQLHQAIMNVALNAAQAIGEDRGEIEIAWEPVAVGGRIAAQLVAPSGDGKSAHPMRLETDESGVHRMWLGRLAPGSYVRFRCRDTGGGISRETIARIFEPFFTTKGAGGGTGLGLSVVLGVVKAHGGGCAIESVPGVGTTFDILLPASASTAADVVTKVGVASAPFGDGGRVLIVDDEDEVAEVTRDALRTLGFDAHATTDPAEALRWLSDDSQRWDALVSDLTMPGMRGDRLIRAARATRPGLVSVLCTGFNEGLSAETLAEIGVARFMKKPVLSEDLATTLAQALRMGDASTSSHSPEQADGAE